MKRIGITSLCLCLSIVLTAQRKDVSDSLYYYVQERNDMNIAYANATLLSLVKPARTGIATLALSREAGQYRHAQQAEKSHDGNFYTEGTARLGRFNLAGSFLFNKMWEDSLSYTLRGVNDDTGPYYYFAGRAGNYNRQQYLLRSIISYNLLKDKLLISTGVNYDYQWTVRTVDPRPDVSGLRVQLRPEITWRLGQHSLGAGFMWGYGKEENSISYSNTNYASNQSDSSRVVFLNRGYGYIINIRPRWRRLEDYYGLSFSYAGELLQWRLQTVFDWSHLKERNLYNKSVTTSRIDYQPFGTWEKNTYTLYLLARHMAGITSQQLSIKGQYIRGLDEDQFDVFASNYSLRRQHVDATWLIRRDAGKVITKEWGLQLSYDDRRQIDALAAHTVHYSFLQPGVSGTIYTDAGKGHRIRAMLSPSVRFPLQNMLTVPATQENMFTRGVVYPDYYYWSATAMITNLEAGWIMPSVPGKLKLGFSVNARLENNLQQPEVTHNTVFKPGNNRLFMRLALNLYL